MKKVFLSILILNFIYSIALARTNTIDSDLTACLENAQNHTETKTAY